MAIGGYVETSCLLVSVLANDKILFGDDLKDIDCIMSVDGVLCQIKSSDQYQKEGEADKKRGGGGEERQKKEEETEARIEEWRKRKNEMEAVWEERQKKDEEFEATREQVR